MSFSSKILEDAVNKISQLPGIGKRTALRLAFFILRKPEKYTTDLTRCLAKLRSDIKYCKNCFSISDSDTCNICKDFDRDRNTICVIENSSNLVAIENTNYYKGLYHVLGGVISPIENIFPENIRLKELFERAKTNSIKEIIIALNSNMESDTTAFYIYQKMKNFDIKLTTLARGIPIGLEIEHVDELNLSKSILKRVIY